LRGLNSFDKEFLHGDFIEILGDKEKDFDDDKRHYKCRKIEFITLLYS